MLHLKPSFLLVVFVIAAISACSAKPETSSVPSDFAFMMDALSRQSNKMRNLHVNIKVNAQGAGRFADYDNGGTISYTPDDIITYEPNQVVKSGKFQLTDSELEQLWDALNKHHFFVFDEHYQAQLGLSYAFIMVEAKGRRHIVDNIGIEVPEIRAIVERVDEILPPAITLEYRKGFTP